MDATAFESALRALQEQRMKAVRPLAERAGEVERAKAQLDAAQDGYARAWADALAAGWTPDELRKVFKDAPAAPARPRRTKPARPAAQVASPPAGGDAA